MSYEMRVYCENCGKLSNLKIPKGTVKEDEIDDAECPFCGVEGHMQFS